MNRDDFSQAVKQTLASRVASQCSNPDCRAATSGPQLDAAKALNIGVAAHIAAAASGGPRFDQTMTPEARASIENGIWLCQNCAKLVDNDAGRFPQELLTAWKTVAEHRAMQSIGKTATTTPGELVQDRYVSLQYVELSGIAPKLKAEGYSLEWIRADREAVALDINGWEIVVHQQRDGSLVRFKVKDPWYDYLIFMKKKLA
jgi:hypothetical protein